MPRNSVKRFNPYEYLRSIEHQIFKLHLISELGYVDALRKFVREKPDVISQIINSTYGELGYTPLHRAAEKGHIRLIQILLDNGADPLVLNPEGYNTIAWALTFDKGVAYRKALENSETWNKKLLALYDETIQSFCEIEEPLHAKESIVNFYEAMRKSFGIQDHKTEVLLGLTGEDEI